MTTVLVVEDEALIAGDIQRTLIRLGYDAPLTAGTGVKALQATDEMRPSLVLMDIKLRGSMDGIEAAEVIRARHDIPIVYLTSHSDETTLSRATATHPYGYLLKPFSDRELRTAIEVALGRHALESKVAARERWFSTTLQSIGDGVITTDPEQNVTFMNGVAEKLSGWGEEAVGRPLAEVMSLVDTQGTTVASPIGAALTRGTSVELAANTSLIAKSGARLAIDDSAAPILDHKGTLLGGVMVFRDITQRRELEERAERSERLASLGMLAAGISHEINNPLTYVIGNTELAVEGLERAIATLGVGPWSDPSLVPRILAELQLLREALHDVEDGASRVQRIVADLRNFARGGEPPALALELSPVLDLALKMTAHAVSHHARVRRDYQRTPLVAGDAAALGQLFMNLLVNAAQAIGDGHADRHEIVVSTFTDLENRAVVEVRDSGPGIPAEVLSKLFDPFFTTKPVGQGMGLGLAICHSIVTQHRGTIVAESPPTGGALFRVTLPPAPAAAVAPKKSARPSAELARRGRVLIVDDDRSLGVVLGRMLRQDHDVTLELDGRTAVACIEGGEVFDLIFCDLMMPNMSGIEVHGAIRAVNPAMAGRMVFMTGGAFSMAAQTFLADPSTVQLAKPFTVEAVREIARRYVT